MLLLFLNNRKAYTGTIVHKNIPHDMILYIYKNYNYQLSLIVSYVFEYYPRIDSPSALFSRKFKEIILSKNLTDYENLISWWCTSKLLCIFTDNSQWYQYYNTMHLVKIKHPGFKFYSYKEVFYCLSRKLLSLTNVIPLEETQNYIPKLFDVMRRFVPGFRQEIETIEQTFIDIICGYIREDYANISFDTFHNLSNSSKDVRTRISTIFLEVLKSYLEAQTDISTKKLGILFDDYFSKGIDDLFEPLEKWISLYKRKETTYQQIIDLMFFPLDCPKYTENFEKEFNGNGGDGELFKKFLNVLFEVNNYYYYIIIIILFILFNSIIL